MSARSPEFVAALMGAVRGEVKAGASLARHSTYRIGGSATIFTPASAADLSAGVQAASAAGIPLFVVGLGSNVLFPDAGLDALVVRMGKGLDAVRHEADRWWLGAGLPAPHAARKTAQQGWAGLHMMVGVPGTVGGGVFMNAGCHGGQWADVVEQVTVVNAQGAARTLSKGEIPFSYRRSGLDGAIVVEVEVRLREGNREELDREVERLFEWRQRGTPFNQPCCGSVFKNPEGPAPAGWNRPWTAGSVIEEAGLKGTAEGAVIVSPMHANYFVNTGGATAAEVRALIARARETVRERIGVVLETEVKVIGRFGEYVTIR
ncbi:MAG: UDP-N-acetylmuramate dehydrogenase [Gemmatimonadales bacterium]|nr:UDP-N-acetylmuramate dehydrogenase [Gemmatimonadales bacterium]